MDQCKQILVGHCFKEVSRFENVGQFLAVALEVNTIFSLSGQGIGLSIFGPGAVCNGKIESSDEQGTVELPVFQGFDSVQVHQVFMVSI